MELMEIPFATLAGIRRDADGALTLELSAEVQNHLGTMHAGAQFTLAESGSADGLLALFPDLADAVVPVLRSSSVKFRGAATSGLSAHATVTEEARSRFLERFERKGRASIVVEVELRDAEEAVTCQGSYEWFVQARP